MKKINIWCAWTIIIAIYCLMAAESAIADEFKYKDGRPAALLRMEAKDQGVILRHGVGPDKCDIYGARDVWVFRAGDTYYLHYDGAGPKGWLACLAVSKDLIHWQQKGPILDLGKEGEDDCKSASYGVTYFDGSIWHMFYLGTPHVSPAPDNIPSFPYLTMKAAAPAPTGPWTKQPQVVPFRPNPDSYYSATASPGQIISYKGEYLQFFSASTIEGNIIKRTLGIARTKDLNGPWQKDAAPLVPLEEQIENSSIYYEPNNATWFLFTNHVGIDDNGEYTDAIWVYWSRDLNRWNAGHKAVVLDNNNCTWSQRCIGLPAVIPVANRLAVIYDGPGGDSISHMQRDIALAWLDLPLAPPPKR